jgi:Flp pilus assembly protein protease CpaA
MLFIVIALLVLIIASYTDIKTLEVPDWLSYSLVAIGLAANLIFTIHYSDFSFIIASLIGLVVSVALGLLMFYTGQWGGGDSKVLFGLGALLGISYPFTIGIYIKFLLNLLVVGAAYGLAWVLFMIVRNWKKIAKNAKKAFNEKRFRKQKLITGIFCIAAAVMLQFAPFDYDIKVLFLIMLAIIYLLNYLLAIVKIVENVSMIKMVEPEKLTEGDWIVDEIKIDGKYIAGPKDLGIEKKNIQELLKYKAQGKIDKVKVKYGIPFVPSFLIAMLYTVITGQIIFLQII